MAVFLDLEDDADQESPTLDGGHWAIHQHGKMGISRSLGEGKEVEVETERPNLNKGKNTEALGCYPIISAIASHIDLNTLDALSRTCRQVRVNLLQYRAQLITSTLRCENEKVELDPEHTFRYRARASDWYFVEAGREAMGVTAGKFGDCARDMVGECRRCGRIICRNCTIKPPAPMLLRHRHRRICTACSKVPLSTLIGPGPSVKVYGDSSPRGMPFEVDALSRKICNCPDEGVWLCQPCGRTLRSADNDYESIWKWRTRYLPSLGGLGVGIGEGNRGVECGRGGECVAAKEVEQETDCDAEDAREIEINSRSTSPSSSPGSSYGSVYGGQMGPGYARHEIEGIGGVVKKKLVRMVKVGACVPEWNDEKNIGKFLVREQNGTARSWCGWCWRVIPGVKDVVE